MAEKKQKFKYKLESKSINCICSICKNIISEPHQVTCCGAVSCGSCIEKQKGDNKQCWSCKSDDYDSLQDVRFDTAIVKCPKHYKGCQWKNEFRRLKEHLNPEPNPNGQLHGCRFYKVQCLYCNKLTRRSEVKDHQSKECLQRPVTCKHCTQKMTYEDLQKSHKATCSEIKIPCPNRCGQKILRKNKKTHECPLDIIDCTFKYAGCTQKIMRKKLESHLKEYKHRHDALHKSCKDKQRGLCVADVQHSLSSHPVCPVELILSDISQYEPENKDWYSTPFCTHSDGYVMCLKVSFCPRDNGDGKYITLNLLLMKGNSDKKLRWPLKANFEVQLLKWGTEEGHHTATMKFNDNTVQECALGLRVTETERAAKGAEMKNFIALAQLKANYLMDNKKCCFRIIKKNDYEHPI